MNEETVFVQFEGGPWDDWQNEIPASAATALLGTTVTTTRGKDDPTDFGMPEHLFTYRYADNLTENVLLSCRLEEARNAKLERPCCDLVSEIVMRLVKFVKDHPNEVRQACNCVSQAVMRAAIVTPSDATVNNSPTA